MKKSRSKARTELHPQGELTIYRALEHFDAMRAALDSNAKTIRLDLSGVSEIDSAGLQLLLLLRKKVESRSASLEIIQASAVVRELLQFCNLGKLILPIAAEQAA